MPAPSTLSQKITRALDAMPTLAWTKNFHEDFPETELYMVGGAIRDLILDRPATDLDFVVRGLPVQVLEAWLQRHGKVDWVGKTFGVYKFLPKNVGEENEPIDIALPRQEFSSPKNRGSRRAFDVHQQSDLSIEADLQRRDFTVNAMAFQIFEQTLLDPLHGQQDINARLIRAVGDPLARLEEDLSRLLRAIRFSCSLGFHIEKNTWEAVRQSASSLQKKTASGRWLVPRETVGKEFLLSFAADSVCTLVKYREAGLGSILFPLIDFLQAETLLSDASGLALRLRLALFFWCQKDPTLPMHLQQFPISHPCHVNLSSLFLLLRVAKTVSETPNSSMISGSLFERWFCRPFGEDLLAFLTIAKAVSPAYLQAIKKRKEKIQERWGPFVPTLLNGDDLLALGFAEGPTFRAMLTAVRDEQIEEKIRTKKQALAFVQKTFPDK